MQFHCKMSQSNPWLKILNLVKIKFDVALLEPPSLDPSGGGEEMLMILIKEISNFK